MDNHSEPASSLQAIDQRLCFALYSCAQAITKKYKVSLSGLNMTYPQYLVYLVLDPHDQMMVSELGKALHLDSGTLTPLLKRMENNSLVIRERDTLDERRVMISLTKKARAMRDEIAQIQQDVACATNLKKDDFTALLAQLKTLNNDLRE